MNLVRINGVIMNDIYYAGVGSRKTSHKTMVIMTEVARSLAASNRVILRSGGARGADLAFEDGVRHNQLKEIYVAHKFGPYPHHIPLEEDMYLVAKNYLLKNEILSMDHWKRLSHFSKRLHARNYYQIFGLNGIKSSFILFWCPYDEARKEYVGGTRTAIRIAMKEQIPYFNVENPLDMMRLSELLVELSN